MAPMSKKQLSKFGLAALAVISIAERRRKQRSTSVGRLWARPHIMARNSTGAFAKLLPVLREREPSQFRNFLRMPVTTFDWLLDLVTPLIVKEDTNYRAAIPPAERLAVTLRFLATGAYLILLLIKNLMLYSIGYKKSNKHTDFFIWLLNMTPIPNRDRVFVSFILSNIVPPIRGQNLM